MIGGKEEPGIINFVKRDLQGRLVLCGYYSGLVFNKWNPFGTQSRGTPLEFLKIGAHKDTHTHTNVTPYGEREREQERFGLKKTEEENSLFGAMR